MKKLIRQVLDELGNTQINLGSEATRETIAALISAALKEKGEYKKYTNDELEEQEAREYWVCEICKKSSYDLDWDYIGSGTNHLSCEVRLELDEEKMKREPNGDEVAKALGHMDKDGNYITEPEGDRRNKSDDRRERVVQPLDHSDRRKNDRREKNWSQEKHEDKVFGSNEETVDVKVFNEAVFGDSRDLTVARIDKLAEEIVTDNDTGYIYESPDGGETVYKRKMGSDKRELVKDWDKIKKNV